jgi:dihydroorotase-like cyclic amidohydrolase
MYSLNTHNTLCLELDELINFNDLVLTASSGGTDMSFMSPEYMENVCRSAADKGFNVRVHALDREMALQAYEILGNLSTSYAKQSFIIISEEELTQKDLASVFTGNAIYIRPEDGSYRFRGEPSDALAYYTEGAAKLLGEEGILGSLEEGLVADFAVFRENPTAISSVDDLFAMEAEFTVIEGETVYRKGVDNAENWTQLMLSQLAVMNEGLEETEE